jgi:hypothetical protein
MDRVVRYVGGPLDGLELDASMWSDDEIRGGSFEVVDGWEDRAVYEPDPAGDPLVWKYGGPVSL